MVVAMINNWVAKTPLDRAKVLGLNFSCGTFPSSCFKFKLTVLV